MTECWGGAIRSRTVRDMKIYPAWEANHPAQQIHGSLYLNLELIYNEAAVATKLNLLLHLQLLLKTTATYGCVEFPLWGSSDQWLFHEGEASCWGFFFSSSVANRDQVLTADVIVESNLRSDLLTSYMSRQRELFISPLNLLHVSMWLKSPQEAWSRKLGTVTGRIFCFFKPTQQGSSRSRSSICARRAISCMSPPCSEPPQAVACS